jgi:Flp pilus assembly protein TadD
MIGKLLLAGGLLFAATAAQAEWHEATSHNFIVYSEGPEQAASDFAAKLERFHYVLRTFHHISRDQSPVKLRVFLLPDTNAVGRMAGGAGVAGYYVPDARGLMLVGTRAATSHGNGDPRSAQSVVNNIDPESVLLHEYTHHFTFEYFPATYPVWYSEGFAEFWGATNLLPGDVVEVGAPAEHRFSTFQALGWMPIERLFTAHNYAEVGGANIFLLYAEGWLINRYIFEHPARLHQVQQYLRLINGGASFADAMHQAFPDLSTFNSELFNYAGSARFNVVRLPFRTIDVGPITTRTLRPAEQALIEDEIKLSQGYPQREATEIASHVGAIAARFPNDPFAIRMVMESQYLAGDNAAALAAADRLLAVEPNNARGLATKGLIQVAGLRAANSTDQAQWTAARQFLVRAVNAAQTDPVVLEAYYRSFVIQGVSPPEDAQSALYSAMELAPSDDEIRYELALDFEHRHMIPEAIAIIRPEAYQVRDRGHESEGERRERERREQRNRQAGRDLHETALEMLTRLQGELNPHDQQRQHEAGH